MLRLILIFWFIWLPQDSGVRYRIVNMSSNKIVIGGQIKKIGDDFHETEKISWSSPSETITAVNLKTKSLFCFSASQKNVVDKFSKSRIFRTEGSLSTEVQNHNDSVKSSDSELSFFYLLIEEEEELLMVPLLNRGEIKGMDGTVYLVWHDHLEDRDILISEDFIALEDILTQADIKAKDKMEASGKIYYTSDQKEMIEDYMDIMHQLTTDYFGDVEYTYEELKILMSTK